jgi:uracil-DNA glycosylase family 4
MATEEQYIWFRHLAQRAYECRLCPRMEAHSAVLGPLNGRIDSRVLFIGEAPGRFGSATTRIPFHGDRSGEIFERLLPLTGLRREDVFITNALLCNPKDELGRNDAPRPTELRSCSEHLRELLDLIQPPWVVTLGKKALDALSLIERHAIVLKEHVATPVLWRGATVVPLYHPGGRVVAVRGLQRMEEEYGRLRALLQDDTSQRKAMATAV